MINPPPLLGTRVGSYEIQAVLGSGGMATVYRSYDHNLQRAVAIKVLSQTVAAQSDFTERFRQEARLIARLRHPNIVQVYDLLEQDGVLYMVQELLLGHTLSDRLAEFTTRNQTMPRREIIIVIQQLAAALDAAHQAGIIHRDIKPNNVLYNTEGAVILTDFGIAKSTRTDVTKTQTGIVLGTPTYVSPEQARGEPLTPANDIYALGVVLYELISGQPPFDSDTPLGIVLKHLHEAPPPLQPLRASVTPQIEDVVRCALAKRPEERFASAGELAQALAKAWPEPSATAAPASVHELPTTAWQPPNVGAASPPAEPQAAAHIGMPAAAIATHQPATSPKSQQRRSFLPLLAVLLVGILLIGSVLAWRNEGSVATPASATAPAGTQAITPAAEATPEPASTVVATSAPQNTILQPVRDVLGADASAAMLTTMESAEQALAANDTQSATQLLGVLQQQILAGRRDGTLAAETMRAALAALQELADQNELQLPLEIG